MKMMNESLDFIIKNIKLFFGVAFILGAFMLSSYHSLNDYGVADSSDPQVLAQAGTTGSGGGTGYEFKVVAIGDSGNVYEIIKDGVSIAIGGITDAAVASYVFLFHHKCVCKGGSCVDGNKISFRILCESDPSPIPNCADFQILCY